jgi:hypothetical protein
VPGPLPCVIDIEASGFGPGSWPVEVGYVLGDGRAFCTLVRPAAHWTHWDAQAQRVHGIGLEAAQRLGRSAAEVAARLNADLGGQTVYCDGWAHDYAWLAALFEEAQQAPRFRLEAVGRLLAEAELARLDDAQRDARAHLGLTRHRASSDARVLQMALALLSRQAAPAAPAQVASPQGRASLARPAGPADSAREGSAPGATSP